MLRVHLQQSHIRWLLGATPCLRGCGTTGLALELDALLKILDTPLNVSSPFSVPALIRTQNY